MTSKMSVRFHLTQGRSKLFVTEAPHDAVDLVLRVQKDGIIDWEIDRHTGKKRVLTYYPPHAVTKAEIQAWDPTIPDQVEIVADALGAAETDLR